MVLNTFFQSLFVLINSFYELYIQSGKINVSCLSSCFQAKVNGSKVS